MSEMLDVTEFTAPKSDQLNSDDLIGRTMTVKITNVSHASTKEQPIAVNFEGDSGKPYKPCKSMLKVLKHVWSVNGKSWIGKSMTLYRDPEVTWGGVKVGGIRISHMSNISEPQTLALTASKTVRKPYVIKPLIVTEQPKAASSPAIPTELEIAGMEAAKTGIEKYKAWLAEITAEQKESIKPHHSKWSKLAKEADGQ